MNETITWLAVGPLCWGRGACLDEAVKNCKKNWPSTRFGSGKFHRDKLSVFTTDDPKVWVDDYGYIRTESGCYVKEIQKTSLKK